MSREGAEQLCKQIFLANEKEWRAWYAKVNESGHDGSRPNGVAQRFVDGIQSALDAAYAAGLREGMETARKEKPDDPMRHPAFDEYGEHR